LLLGSAAYHSEAQTNIVGPSASVRIVIRDNDLNANPLDVDKYGNHDFVTFRTSRDEVGEANPEIVETGPSTGVFEFTIQLKTDERACAIDFLGDSEFEAEGGSDPSAGACPGDVLVVEYEDERTANGRSELVSYVFEVKSWDPEFQADQISYDPGDRVSVDIFDPDANRDPDVSDSLTDLRVFSDSDPGGRQFSAIETGKNTGMFRLTFMTALEPQGNSIVVGRGDELTVQYTDGFPADFSAFEEEKKFSYVIVAGPSTDGALTPSALAVAAGEDELVVGKQVSLFTEIKSSFLQDEMPFIAIMEVRDANGVTAFLGWQTGTLRPQDQTQADTSWLPEQPGRFEARIFLISSFQDPRVLSQTMVSEITISGNSSNP